MGYGGVTSSSYPVLNRVWGTNTIRSVTLLKSSDTPFCFLLNTNKVLYLLYFVDFVVLHTTRGHTGCAPICVLMHSFCFKFAEEKVTEQHILHVVTGHLLFRIVYSFTR